MTATTKPSTEGPSATPFCSLRAASPELPAPSPIQRASPMTFLCLAIAFAALSSKLVAVDQRPPPNVREYFRTAANLLDTSANAMHQTCHVSLAEFHPPFPSYPQLLRGRLLSRAATTISPHQMHASDVPILSTGRVNQD